MLAHRLSYELAPLTSLDYLADIPFCASVPRLTNQQVTISQVRTYLAPPKAKGQATTAAVSKQKEEDKEKKPSLTLPGSPVIIDDKPIKSEEL